MGEGTRVAENLDGVGNLGAGEEPGEAEEDHGGCNNLDRLVRSSSHSFC